MKHEQIKVTIVVLACILFIILAWIFYSMSSSTTEQLNKVSHTAEETSFPALQSRESSKPTQPQQHVSTPMPKKPKPINGTIRGSLTYPGSSIPSSLHACAKNQVTGKEYCSNGQISDDSFIYGKGYEISVPAGKYIVYSAGIPDSPVASGTSYYNSYMQSFVATGNWPEYPSCAVIKTLDIAVAAGETTQDIAIGDWYHEGECKQ